ncbi:GlcG/HbpS family heme-binding protein [Glycomyces salinus]|uniref:GlcG/HbpS family heme-binding protein n=1 Tax=Glycomyces salinus TaxID=980294 RepID=UPI0018ECBF18|nr:heme-binding protein [Glycomyces salinus]
MSQFVETAAVSHAAAQRLVAAAVAEGASRGIAVAAAVVDPAMALVAYLRADGTTPHSAETSRRKANTSASTRKPTGWMQGDFALALPLGTGNLVTNIRGGHPLVAEGKNIGGLGVAGGAPDQDAEIAEAALAREGFEC